VSALHDETVEFLDALHELATAARRDDELAAMRAGPSPVARLLQQQAEARMSASSCGVVS